MTKETLQQEINTLELRKSQLKLDIDSNIDEIRSIDYRIKSQNKKITMLDEMEQDLI